MPRRPLRPTRLAGRLGLLGLAALGGVALGRAVMSVLVARTVVAPPSRRPEDIRIRRVDLRAHRIELQRTAASGLPGQYSFWFDGDSGNARLGEIVEADEQRVVRTIAGVDFGDLERATRGRFSGWFWLSPR